MRRTLTLLAVVTAIAVLTGSASACPMCSSALENGQTPQLSGSARGFYFSILFMLSMPYLLLACFGVAFYRLFQRGQAINAAAETSVSEPVNIQQPPATSPDLGISPA